MLCTAIGRGLAGGVVILAMIMVSSALCQDFPYLVPDAPEFDSRGNLIRSATPSETQRPRMETSRRTETRNTAPTFANPPKTPQPGENQRYRSERSESPRASYYGRAAREAVPAAVAPAPRYAPPPSAQPNPNQPPYQQGAVGAYGTGQPPSQQRQDCSEYLQRITYARSEAEMQAAARYYLGCLMQNGLDQQTATRHVSSLVDTWYSANR
ncbi:MAG: hypothetical protein LDL33_00380 [Desulfomonile sp.]|nr:hypothetical protein [Desulfomonile sp.]